MTPTRLIELLAAFPTKRVCIIGDAMVDEWVYCLSNRESPEAPGVPVLLESSPSEACLGGAANVAANVAALQGISTEPIREEGKPLRGPDSSNWPILMNGAAAHQSFNLREMCMSAGVLPMCFCHDRELITKTRVFNNGKQVARIDREWCGPVDPTDVLRRLRERQPFDLILIADYAKGMVTQALLDGLPEVAFRAIAPKPASGLKLCEFGLIQMNEVEDESTPDIDPRPLHYAVTLGRAGMLLASYAGYPEHYPSVTRNLVDPCGAGDTTFAALSLALACGATAPEAAELAMHAAAVVCEKPRTAVCGREELIAHLTL